MDLFNVASIIDPGDLRDPVFEVGEPFLIFQKVSSDAYGILLDGTFTRRRSR